MSLWIIVNKYNFCILLSQLLNEFGWWWISWLCSPMPSWARKGPFLHSKEKGPCRQTGRWYLMTTPTWGYALASLISVSHVRHARSRERESFYRTGPSKATKFSDSVQKDMNVTNQVSTLFLFHRNPCVLATETCQLVVATNTSLG